MLFALHLIDFGVLALYLAAMVAIGAYFAGQQHTSKDFFLAGRSMGWFPVGLSIMATLLSALSYTGIPGEAYYAGLMFLLLPLAVWITAPVMTRFFLPLYVGLELYSVYEYLEMRFSADLRYVSSAVFVVWRLLWLGGVLFAPCKVLVVAAGLDIPMWLLLIVLGLVSTAYTFLGGMKAVIWTDVIQSLVMAAGLVLIIGGVWWALDDGPAEVWRTARSLGRDKIFKTEFSWTDGWALWAILPHYVLSMLSFYVADQITAQRFLTARSLRVAQRSFVLNCVSVSLMVPALMYVGISLLAFYNAHPEALQPKWVANVDNSSGDPRVGDSIDFAARDRALDELGETFEPSADPALPLLDWTAPQDQITPDNIERLVEQKRILAPNSKLPLETADDLITSEGRIDAAKLAMRLPSIDSSRPGEIVLNKRAKDELMPRFITTQLAAGVAGVILAALFAASMSSMDSGLNSICTLLVMDFHRRLGWGRAWLARRLNKPVDQLTEADELKLGRPLVLLIGVAATIASMLIAQVDDIFDIMIKIVNTFGGPLMAVFLLGVFTRRANAFGALCCLILGTAFTVWLVAANDPKLLPGLWPFSVNLAGVWPLSFSVLFSLAVGYLASLLAGQAKSKEELRGLVVGIGRLGVRDPEEASIVIIDPDQQRAKKRWR